MKKIGIISFFPAFSPPRSGGELRLHHLAKHLASRGFDIRMVAPTYGEANEEIIRHAANFQELRLPKTRIYGRAHHIVDKIGHFSECSGLVCSLVGRFHERLRREARLLSRECDIIVHESPFLFPLVPDRRKPGQLLVYNSYNVETRMAADMFGKSLAGRAATAWVARMEKKLLHRADLIFACSEDDAALFESRFGVGREKIAVVPNGVDVDAIQPCDDPELRKAARRELGLRTARSMCFFLGSYHPPNIEAVDLILHRLAPSFPEVDFLIAGNVCKAYEGRPVPENLRLMGLIDENTKTALFRGADVALNTVISGSGTNLKMLDALSAGLPVLTTSHGARGLRLEHRRHAIVSDLDQLEVSLEELLGDPVLQRTLSREGRLHAVQNFSWSAIADEVADVYTLKLNRRVVILNDYQVHPADRGGRVRVDAVSRELAGAGLGVTILTLTTEPHGRRLLLQPRLEEINVPRSRLHRGCDALLAHLVGCSADDVSALVLTRWMTPALRRQLLSEMRTAGAVMLSHPYMESQTHGLIAGKELYYDSHNTEYELKEKLFHPGVLSRFLVRRVRRAEIDACRRAQAVFCVSDENRSDLEALVPGLNDRAYISPNGVDCGAVQVMDAEERRRLRRGVGFGREFVAIFLGSGHPPNREAAELIINRMSREHPRVLFLIVGSVAGWFWSRPMPGNVLLMGMVSTPVKNFLLETSDFALNPMMTGSGTSLKLFDYMAAGLPVLSTDIGARGLDAEAMKAVVLLEPEQFSRGLRELLGDPERCRALAETARRVAQERFDWPVTLRDMRHVIANHAS